MPRVPGPKKRILELFLSNVGKVLETPDIQAAGGGFPDWPRKIRALRRIDGYQILSRKDRPSLNPSEFVMETTERLPSFSPDISQKIRDWVFEQKLRTCQMCGYAAGDPDPFGGIDTVRLTISYIVATAHGGDDSPRNLCIRCTDCEEGMRNIVVHRPDQIALLTQVRRATIDNQEAILNWLLQKFSLEATAKQSR
jgi:hypothetical protein